MFTLSQEREGSRKRNTILRSLTVSHCHWCLNGYGTWNANRRESARIWNAEERRWRAVNHSYVAWSSLLISVDECRLVFESSSTRHLILLTLKTESPSGRSVNGYVCVASKRFRSRLIRWRIVVFCASVGPTTGRGRRHTRPARRSHRRTVSRLQATPIMVRIRWESSLHVYPVRKYPNSSGVHFAINHLRNTPRHPP